MRVLISGAGVAGLACGLRLARAGHEAVVVEKAPEIREGGYLVALSHNAYHFAEDLGLVPCLRKRALTINASAYLNASGKTLLSLDYNRMFGSLDIVQIMREDLVRCLFEAAQECVDIRFSTRIESLENSPEGVSATLSTGQTESFDLVVGADGVHSHTRRMAFEESEVYQDVLGLWCAAFRSRNVLNLDRKFETHMDGDRYMATFTTREGDLGNVFVWAVDDVTPPKPEDRAQALLDAFNGAGEAISTVLNECPRDQPFYFDNPAQIVMKSWHRDRVVLAGDAAHSLTLFSGRGAACAFSGGNRLAQALIEQPSIPNALSEYDRQMRPLIETVQPATRNAVRWYVPRKKWEHLVRDNLMAYLPNAFFQKYFQRKYSYS